MLVEEADRELIEGAVDLYVHAEPDLIPRQGDDIALARELQAAGYRSALHRHHFSPTAERAALASRATGFDLRGALITDAMTGGMNPAVVEHALRMGVGWIGLPTVSASYFRSKLARMAPEVRALLDIGDAVEVVSPDGQLLPAAGEVLALVADRRAVLAVGYFSVAEVAVVIRAAVAAGIERVVLSNPLSGAMGMTRDDVIELMAVPQVVLEVSVYQHHDSAPRSPGSPSLADCAALVGEVGVDRVVLSSDGGIVGAPSPPVLLAEGMRAFLAAGLTPDEVGRLVRESPARLLDR